ncbi:SpoIIE family protein phosphatase [Streptomyces liangshanensis]|uniref:SpoIIE family protein phosphatase n=1 Tax=Streptomyces liangshanensis TaxID=2717324 RepID=UPI0036DD8186
MTSRPDEPRTATQATISSDTPSADPSHGLFRAARNLTGAAVPTLADASSVDVLEQLLRGEAPPPGPVDGSELFRCAAFAATREDVARSTSEVGRASQFPDATPFRRSLSDLRPRLIRHLSHQSRWLARDPGRARMIREAGAHSLIVLPLTVRGVVLGLFVLYRLAGSNPFGEDSLREAARLAERAALSLDTVRRRIEEDALARLLRQSPGAEELPELGALEAVHGQYPAEAGAAHWYDVLPLSGARVALVVGTAAGSGVPAAVGMHQLRAVITTLSALDLRPDELLARLDDVVTRLDRRRPVPYRRPDGGAEPGTSCLYVIYDPTTERCVSARAGDPSVLVADPDGGVSAPVLAAHGGLGTDGEPFENTEFDTPAGSTLVLRGGNGGGRAAQEGRSRYADGDGDTDAPAHPGTDPDVAVAVADDPTMERLREAMPHSAPHLARLAAHLLRHLPEDLRPPVLLARTRALANKDVADLTLPPDPSAVSTARAWAGRRLTAWLLDDLADDTTLVVSELVTNAVRYSGGPIGLRLIRDEHVLICEVSDTSGAGPHPVRPRATDEGGRGLTIVGRLTAHQGTRYTSSGKTVWTEQPLPE